MKQTIKISEADNVAVALGSLSKGELHEGVVLVDDIPEGHKFSLCAIEEGGRVIKCGNPVAKALTEIPAGAHVHTHNAASNLAGNLGYSYTPSEFTPAEVKPRTVNVYRRENGSCGIRNELWIIPISGCVNGQAKLILKTFKNRFGVKGFDGAYAFTHPYGDFRFGGDNDRTREILQKMIRHPNAGGVLVIGLGGVDDFRLSLGGVNSNRIKFLDCREVEDEIEKGVQLLNGIAEIMKLDVREATDISCLKVGLKCGCTDYLTGITANPLVGRFTDYLTSAGGTAALCEVAETFGSEQFMMNRADSEQTFEKILTLVNRCKDYYREHGRAVYVNPSPESIDGGITTIEEKSVLCTQKSGSSPVRDVVSDGEFITSNGLNVLNGPDNDMCEVTNLAVAGCQMVLFTTGLGTPFGGFVPTVKISSNSGLAAKKSNWIDFNAGAVLDTDYDTQLEKLSDFIVAVANGKLTKNEVNNSREIAVLKTGITL